MKLFGYVLTLAMVIGCDDTAKPSCVELGCKNALCTPHGDCTCNGTACTFEVGVDAGTPDAH